jgi:histidine triad (HIT) family protein
MSCLFCRIISREIPAQVIYEDDQVLAFLDINPVSKGHTLVIPKEHADNLSAGTPQAAAALMAAVYTLAPKIMQALGAQGYNLGMNHGEVAGQEVLHTHLHIMPRYEGQPRTFTKLHPSPEELQTVGDKIRQLC